MGVGRAVSSVRGSVWVGAVWLAMPLVFEFGFGRLVARKSWSELVADYDLLAGRIWLVVPAPYLVARVRGLVRRVRFPAGSRRAPVVSLAGSGYRRQ